MLHHMAISSAVYLLPVDVCSGNMQWRLFWELAVEILLIGDVVFIVLQLNARVATNIQLLVVMFGDH